MIHMKYLTIFTFVSVSEVITMHTFGQCHSYPIYINAILWSTGEHPRSGGPWSCAVVKPYGIKAVKDVCLIFKVKNGKENYNESELNFGIQFNDSISSKLT